jgi:hypothetical protein
MAYDFFPRGGPLATFVGGCPLQCDFRRGLDASYDFRRGCPSGGCPLQCDFRRGGCLLRLACGENCYPIVVKGSLALGSATRSHMGRTRQSILPQRLASSIRLPLQTSRPDLLNLLHVLGRLIALEPAQAELLNRISAGPLRSVDELRDAGAFADVEPKSANSKTESKNKALGREAHSVDKQLATVRAGQRSIRRNNRRQPVALDRAGTRDK